MPVPLRAALFDVDGTLLDTKEDWAAAFNEALALVGRPPMPVDAIARWIGTPLERILEAMGIPADDVPRAAAEFMRAEHEALRRDVRPFPRIPEALASLASWRLAAVTNKRSDTAREALRLAGLLDSFHAIVGGDAADRKKPAPDPVLRAAELLQAPVRACAVVGDTENDIRAGREAGARTVGVLWGYGTRRSLEDAGVEFLVEAPDALPPLLRALTPSKGTGGTCTRTSPR